MRDEKKRNKNGNKSERERRKYEIEREKRINLIFNKSPLNANLDRLIRLLTPLWCHYRLANNISFLSLSPAQCDQSKSIYLYTKTESCQWLCFQKKISLFFVWFSFTLARSFDWRFPSTFFISSKEIEVYFVNATFKGWSSAQWTVKFPPILTI
jgi:hypothetical protein